MNKARGSSPWHRDQRMQERENKRQAVLLTAARLFSERGYHGTSLELVADDLGITRPTVYYYFKSKDDILFECVRLALKTIQEATQVVAKQRGTAAERLRAALVKYAEIMMADFGRCLVLVGEDPLPPQSRAKLRKLMSDVDLTLRELVQQSVTEGSYVTPDVKLATFAVAGSLNSIARWYRPGGALQPTQIAESFVGTLINGLAVRSKPGQPSRPTHATDDYALGAAQPTVRLRAVKRRSTA
jgi:AcrR family transcriptional regulator